MTTPIHIYDVSLVVEHNKLDAAIAADESEINQLMAELKTLTEQLSTKITSYQDFRNSLAGNS